MPGTSVYEAAGGDPAFARLAAAHHERCLQDPVLEHPFSHPGHPEHVQRLGWYWAEVFGGPTRFSESCGGQTAMLLMHSGTGAEDDLGERFRRCFARALDDAALPDDPRLRAVLNDYMAYAVDQIMQISPAGSSVAPSATVPRWSWDGPQQP